MTDRELLTRAAEAAGLQIEYWAQEDYPVVRVGENKHGWNPIKFNSDALALAVRMEMDVFVRAGRWTEAVAPMGEPYKAMHGVHGDAETATRFAITMAALGKPRDSQPVPGGTPVEVPVRRRRRASTATIANAMRILAADIQSGDGVANGACLEAAARLEELAKHEREDVKKMRSTLRVISTWAACDALSPAADVYRMCREALGKRG